jgi:hypothetical protein
MDKKAASSCVMMNYCPDDPTTGRRLSPEATVEDIRLLEQGKDRAF